MSGHSRWSQIKRQKGVEDLKKGREFSKFSKLISIAAKTGVGLDTVIERAKAANMPKENIERAIKRASEKGGELFELTVKALTSSGIGIAIDGITDNKNRTMQELKMLLAHRQAKIVDWIPDYAMPLDDQTKALIAELEEHEDIKEVRTNSGN